MKHYGRFFVILFLVDALLTLLSLHFIPAWQDASNQLSNIVACFTLPLLVLAARHLVAPRAVFLVLPLFYLAWMAIGVVMLLSVDHEQARAASHAGASATLALLRSEVPWYDTQERVAMALQVCLGIWALLQWARLDEGPAVALPADDPRRESLTGIGGWLWLLGFGVVVMPCLVLFSVVTGFLPFLGDADVLALVLPSSSAFNGLMAALFAGELLANVGLLAGGAWVAVLFFRREARFRTAYIAMAMAYIGVFLVDALATKLVFPETDLLDEQTTRAVRNAVWSAAIWVPYVLVSRRARYTFTR